eukprot:3795857-Amphidinium_carterae.1
MHSVALEQQARYEVDVLVADEKRPTEDQPETASKIRRRRATQEEKDAHQRKGVTLLEGMKLQAGERIAKWEKVP